MKYYKLFFIISFFNLVFLMEYTGCSPDIFQRPKAPVIVSLEMSAYEVDPGDTVRVTVTVQDSKDDVLHYEWSTNGGQFIQPLDRPDVRWKAPAVGGSFTITVTVSNEKKSSSQSGTITVRSYLRPYVEILSPKNGEYYVQYTTLNVRVQAQHSNGIHSLSLYVSDTLRTVESGHPGEQYDFMYQLSDSAGSTEIKVEAIANTTGTMGKDSVNIVIEGIVLGKRER